MLSCSGNRCVDRSPSSGSPPTEDDIADMTTIFDRA